MYKINTGAEFRIKAIIPNIAFGKRFWYETSLRLLIFRMCIFYKSHVQWTNFLGKFLNYKNI